MERKHCSTVVRSKQTARESCEFDSRAHNVFPQSRIMSFRYLALASFIAATAGHAAVPLDGCLVCGDRNVITVPDAVFITPDQPAATRDQLQTAGLDGQIQIAQCLLLSGMISDLCGCMPGDLPGGPAPTPVDAQGMYRQRRRDRNVLYTKILVSSFLTAGIDDGDSGDDGSNADKTLKDSKIKSGNRSVDTPVPVDVRGTYMLS